MRMLIRCAVVAIITLVVGGLGMRAADAHAVLEGTDPPAGSVLEVSPPTVSLRFNEPVSLSADAVRVLDVDGRGVDLGDAAVVDDTVTVSLPPSLPNGSYVVTWRVRSTDSHPVAGAFTFAVGAPSVSESGESAAEVARRASGGGGFGSQAAVDVAAGVVYLGVLLAAGAAAFALLALPAPIPPAGRRTLTLIRVGAGVAIAGSAALVFAEAMLYETAGWSLPAVESLRHELGGSVGLQSLLVVIGSALLLFAWCRFDGYTLPRVVASASGSALVLSAFAVVGHTRTATPVALVATLDIAHVAAAATWFGGVVGLALYLRATARNVEPDPSSVSEQTGVVTRFSAVATGSVVVVMVAGLILSWSIVGPIDELFSTRYGVLLLIKVGLFGVVALIGAYNHFALVPRLEASSDPSASTSRLRRTLVAEGTVILAIIAVTAVLTNTSPPAVAASTAAGNEHDHGSHTSATTDAGGPVEVRDDFGAGQATVALSPARVGANEVTITLTDAAGAPIELLESPVVAFRLRETDVGPITQEAEAIGPGTYRAVQDLPLAGDWEINVSGKVSDFDRRQAIVVVPVE